LQTLLRETRLLKFLDIFGILSSLAEHVTLPGFHFAPTGGAAFTLATAMLSFRPHKDVTRA
jgi:hypothetical protein